MNRNEAKQLVEKTFKNPFSKERFESFIKNLLPGVEQPSTSVVAGAQLPQGFGDHIVSITRVGTYRDPAGEILDAVAVKLKNPASLDRARTRQRNLIAHYLTSRGKDATLAAFYSDESPDWRFSFVRLAHTTDVTEKGSVIARQEFTPARRFSFLVGETEPSHTAQQQLSPLLQKTDSVSLTDLEAAFNIEAVTGEFFDRYKELYLHIKGEIDDALESSKATKKEFERCAINSAAFAKKLLGQIVFLYFIQKKGWLGVARSDKWGSGDRDFLFNLFKKKGKRTYFTEILQPFFYEALALERPGDFYKELDCRVPFLNGGLFEPLNGYHWQATPLNLTDQTFSKIFEVFNLYNFTVKEDEPLEKEVAVDPEVLGKVFENLLEEKDRRGAGAYYTPREIVHYMCQESLIHYLDNKVNENERLIPLEDFELFIRSGDAFLENDSAKDAGRASGKYGLRESVRKSAQAIDDALAGIKVCDPAVGSGAFPVGMMTEIVRARSILSNTPEFARKRSRTPYDFKWHCIENSLYGVDTEPSAVEIAKLRLWLSLVVDEEDYQAIRPLPNLDYKIVYGDSLHPVQETIFNTGLFPQLEQKKIQYFTTTNYRSKQKLREEITELITLVTEGEGTFDFRAYFSEVVGINTGFDVVITNPPYIGEKGHKDLFRRVRQSSLGEFYEKNADIFYFFFHVALDIANSCGVISFITTNYYLTATGARILRRRIKQRSDVLHINNFNTLRIFESARGQHNAITILSKHRTGQAAQNSVTHRNDSATAQTLQAILSGEDAQTEYFLTPQSDLFHGPQFYIRLGQREIDSILDAAESTSRELQATCDVYKGIELGANEVYVFEGLPPFYSKLSAVERELIKPYHKNSDIQRYFFRAHTKYILYFGLDINLDEYPQISRYLLAHKARLSKRAHIKSTNQPWYSLLRTRNPLMFSEFPKIVTSYRSRENSFAYTEEPFYSGTDTYYIINSREHSLKFILGVLNSRFTLIWLKNRGKVKGEILELTGDAIAQIRIPLIDTPAKQRTAEQIVELVDLILKDTKPDAIKKYSSQIDALVYEIYELDGKEIELLEQSLA